MTIIETKNPGHEQRDLIRHLWNREYPAQIQYASGEAFDGYLDSLQEPCHWLAVDKDNNLAGWGFSFVREGEKWFAIIVDIKIQRRGLGTRLLRLLKENEAVLNGWVTDHDRYRKANGAPYPPPLQFYIKNGFIVIPEARIETEQLSAVKIRWTKA
jgi:GNAT superfamily N-acetyltransferase